MIQEEHNFIMFLEDIQTAMSRIGMYIEGYDFEHFKRDFKTVDAVIRNFEIIGEAAKNIEDKIKDKYTEVPWKEMYYLRNRVAHEYFGVDYEIIWDVATNYLPMNKIQIDIIIDKEK